jgi:hypothetical protein
LQELSVVETCHQSDNLILEALGKGSTVSVSAIEIADGWLLLPPLEYESDAAGIPAIILTPSAQKFWRSELSNDKIYELFNIVKKVILAFRCKDAAIVYFSLAERPQVSGIDMMPALGPDDPLVYSGAQVRLEHEVLLLNVLASTYRRYGLAKSS